MGRMGDGERGDENSEGRESARLCAVRNDRNGDHPAESSPCDGVRTARILAADIHEAHGEVIS